MIRGLPELGNPTLLRVDDDGGHGVGATRSQFTSMWVDFFTFVFWQSGERGWQAGGEGVPTSALQPCGWRPP
jgi:hypothetical protein